MFTPLMILFFIPKKNGHYPFSIAKRILKKQFGKYGLLPALLRNGKSRKPDIEPLAPALVTSRPYCK